MAEFSFEASSSTKYVTFPAGSGVVQGPSSVLKEGLQGIIMWFVNVGGRQSSASVGPAIEPGVLA